MDRKISHFFQNLSQLKDCGQFCDVKVIVEDQEFLVHRVIVASFSEFFRAVCSCEMKEALESRVTITHLEKDQVETVMDYIYGAWQFPIDCNIDQVLRIAEAANYLGISCLSEYCSDYLLRNNDRIVLISYYNTFESLNLQSLINVLNVYILKNFEYVLDKLPEFFSSINSEQLLGLISSDSLVVSSEDKLLSYVVEQCLSKLSIDDDRDTIKNILYEIRPGLLKESFQQYMLKLNDYNLESWRDDVSLHTIQQYRASKLGRIMSYGSSVLPAFRERASDQCFAILSSKNVVLIKLGSSKEISFELKFPLSSDTAEICSTQLLGCIFIFIENSTVNSHYLSGQFYLLDIYSLTLHNLPDLSAHIVKFTMVAVNRHLYAIGGIDKRSFISSDKIYELDLTTMEWDEYNMRLPSARHSFPAVVYDGNIYISGGTVYTEHNNDQQPRHCYKDFFYLDLKNKSWVHLPDMTKPIFEHTMVESSGKFYVVGDIQRGQHSVDCYDPVSSQWTTIADDSSLRGITRFLGSFSSLDGKLYCFGKHGQRTLGEHSGRGVWSFDLENCQFDRLLRTDNTIFDGHPYVWSVLLNWDLVCLKSASGETITNFAGDLDDNLSEDSDF